MSNELHHVLVHDVLTLRALVASREVKVVTTARELAWRWHAECGKLAWRWHAECALEAALVVDELDDGHGVRVYSEVPTGKMTCDRCGQNLSRSPRKWAVRPLGE